MDWVLDWRRLMPRLGTRKLYHLIKPQLIEAGIKLGRDGLFNLSRPEMTWQIGSLFYDETYPY